MMKNKTKITASVLREMVVTSLVILVFLGVIIAYYIMLASETRQRIIKNSELVAKTAAQEINTYLSNGIHALTLTCHTLDNMLRDARPQDEIRSFLINQTVAAERITSGNTTGLYGYVNGEYLDGTGWVPEADYVPTKRPWYIGARANNGQVAVVDPYLDVYSNSIMISLAKTLCDFKSVAALDFSLNPLQVFMEGLTTRNEADIEIVLDRNYQVLAHSSKSELGKNYMAEEGTFGHALVDMLRAHGEGYFSFSFDGANYIVYTAPVMNDWLCLSIFDATPAFRQLRNILIFTVVASVLVAFVLSLIMGYSNRKARLARELRLKEKAERAAAASEAKSAFLSNMSHEIRTPINAVLGMNEMIRRESGNQQSVIEYTKNIHTAGSRLLGLVNDILDFSKIETGKMEIVPADYDLSSLLNDLADMIQAKTEEKGLLLKLDFDETMPKLLHGDGRRIRQVAANLLTNAVKYTEKGSVAFHVGYEKIPDAPDDVFLDFSVSDTGIGIRPEDIEKLFTEFERIEEKRNRSIAGLGLGLNITKRLLEMMGSKLKVESVYGQGSTFSFRLRQKVTGWEALGNYRKACRAPLPAPEQTKARKTFTAPDASVLVVDDTPMNLTVFMGLLKSTKMQIDTAESGGEGLALSRSRKYDIIVLDHMMPEKDGIETLHELKTETDNPNLHTPVICLTANAISGARERYLAEGFDDYLSKPIEGADLEAAIYKYLSQEKVTLQTAPEEGKGETTELRTFYASVPELNYGDAIRFCANEEVLKETLKQFYRAIKPNITAIDGFLTEKDYKNYTIRVHALKSSARLIGAEALSADARHLEDLGNSLTREDIDHIEELTPRLLEDYRKFLKLLSPLYAKEEAARESAPEISVSDLNEAYEAIKQFVESFDIDAIDIFIAEIRKYRIPKPEEAKFAAVEECVRNMDWNGLEEALKG
ncbi:MAG: response regulator [Fretibacterium sp.]|nr:response regulator [Fretibacterium sp.]